MYSKAVVPENPSKRMFGWYAKHYGDIITDEFNDNGSEIDFKTLDKNTVKEFGLYGGGSNLWFETRDGVFHITSKKGSHGIRLFLDIHDQCAVTYTGKTARL